MGEANISFIAIKDWVDQSLIKVKNEKLFFDIYMKNYLPDGSGSLTFFLLIYSWEGPFRLLTE